MGFGTAHDVLTDYQIAPWYAGTFFTPCGVSVTGWE